MKKPKTRLQMAGNAPSKTKAQPRSLLGLSDDSEPRHTPNDLIKGKWQWDLEKARSKDKLVKRHGFSYERLEGLTGEEIEALLEEQEELS